MFGGFGSLGIPGSLGSRLRSGATNYATTWNFFRGDAEFAKTPWAALTRSGLGTRVGPDGTVGYGPHNLLLWSDDLSVSPWVAGGNGTTASTLGGVTTITASGPPTATRLQTIVVGNQQITWSIDIVGGTAANVTIGMTDLTTGDVAITVNPHTGIVLNSVVGGSWSSASSNIKSIDGGFRYSITVTKGAGTSVAAYISVGSGAGTTTLVKRAQINLGPITDYVPTTTTAHYLPRIDHDPVTHAALGLLVEVQATNLWPTNRTFASWTTESGASVSANAATGVDGVASSAAVMTATGNGSSIYRIVSVSSGQVLVGSIYAKRLTGSTDLRVQVGGGAFTGGDQTVTVSLSSGAVTSNTAGLPVWVESRADGYYRISVGRTATSTNTTYWDFNATASGTIAFDLAQLEVASAPSSVIHNPGTGTALRAADGWHLSGAAFNAAIDPSIGTLYVEFFWDNRGGVGGVFSLNDPTIQFRLDYRAGQGRGYVIKGGSIVADLSPAGLIANGINKLAVSWSATGVNCCLNGQTPASASGDFSLSAATRLYLGCIDIAEDHLGLPIRTARSFRGQYITGAALQALTA